MRFLLCTVFIAASASVVWADRPVTEEERAKLVSAVTAQGCSGGKMTWDEGDREFEVDDAVCDGRKYDLKFDAELRPKAKKLDE